MEGSIFAKMPSAHPAAQNKTNAALAPLLPNGLVLRLGEKLFRK